MSNHLYVSLCSSWYLSHSSRGVIPSFRAWVSLAVPYSSVPQMYNVLRFRVPEGVVRHRSLAEEGRVRHLREYLWHNRKFDQSRSTENCAESNAPTVDVSTECTPDDVPCIHLSQTGMSIAKLPQSRTYPDEVRYCNTAMQT